MLIKFLNPTNFLSIAGIPFHFTNDKYNDFTTEDV